MRYFASVDLCTWYYKQIIWRSLCTPVQIGKVGPVVDRKSWSLIPPYQQRNHNVVPGHRLWQSFLQMLWPVSLSLKYLLRDGVLAQSVPGWVLAKEGWGWWKRWPGLVLVSALRGILLLKNANVVGTNFVQEREQTLKGPFFNLPVTSSLIAKMNA